MSGIQESQTCECAPGVTAPIGTRKKSPRGKVPQFPPEHWAKKFGPDGMKKEGYAQELRQDWLTENRDKIAARQSGYFQKHKDKIVPIKRIRICTRREIAVVGYGGVCEKCGNTDHRLLVFHHSWKDGKHHRQTDANFVEWAIKNNFPKDRGIELLCANCHRLAHHCDECVLNVFLE